MAGQRATPAVPNRYHTIPGSYCGGTKTGEGGGGMEIEAVAVFFFAPLLFFLRSFFVTFNMASVMLWQAQPGFRD